MREDNEVLEGECLGVSSGETETEFDAEDGGVSRATVRCRAALRRNAVDDMVDGSEKGCSNDGRREG